MKKITTTCVLLMGTILSLYAQSINGIYFENGLNWEQIKEKAKIEKKYIFVDAYTTWCGPCRMMDKEIFPQENAGTFFNKNFINVKVQIDVTKNDSEETKNWYEQAKAFQKDYQINQFPTFLIFNYDGKPINKIIGASANAIDFINITQLAIEPANQFYALKSKYQAGDSSSTLVNQMLNAGLNVREYDFVKHQGNIYLNKQKNLLTDDNLKIIAVSTTQSDHPGFKVLIENPAEVDAILGLAKRKELIMNAATNEVVVPYLRTGGKMTDLGGGFHSFSGELIENVNWDLLEKKLTSSYSVFTDEIMMSAKPMYFDWKVDLVNYTKSVNDYVINYKNLIPNLKLIAYSNNLLNKSSSADDLKSALTWVNLALRDDDLQNPYFKYQKAALSYKLGENQVAIKELESAINIFETSGEGRLPAYKNLLEKMKTGEKIW